MFKKFLRDEGGSAIILELAVIMIIMVMIFYGFTMYTNALSISLALRTAAREGAREYATTHNPAKGIQRASTELSLSNMGGASITAFEDGDGRGIEVVKDYPFFIPFAGTQGARMKGVAIFVEEPLPDEEEGGG